MGVFDTGGGGGRAGGETTDEYALDQPFEIDGQFTADTAAKINEMFSILFKSLKRTKDDVDKLRVRGGELLLVTRYLSELELEALATVDIRMIPAPGPRDLIVPTSFVVYINVPDGYTNSMDVNLTYEGSATAVMDAAAIVWTTNDTKRIELDSSLNLQFANVASTFDPRGKAMVIKGDTPLTGTGAVTGVAVVSYFIIPDLNS